MALVFLISLPCLARAEPVLDTHFGNGGTVNLAPAALAFSGGRTQATVLPDRRVVVATIRGAPGPSMVHWWYLQPRLWVARLQPDGSVDPTFGNGAPVLLDLSSTQYGGAFVHDLRVRPDGSLFALVAFFGRTGGPRQTVLIDIAADGRFDAAFNGGAPLVVSSDTYNRMKIFDTDSGYLVVGIGPSRTAPISPGFDAWRLRADGTLDPAFGNGGNLVVAEGNTDDVMIVPGGGFQLLHLESGTPASTNFWRRYRADGSLDTAFGNGGDTAIPVVDGTGVRDVHPLGDGTYAGVSGASCVQRLLDDQGRTLSAFDGPCIGAAMSVAPYGDRMLVTSADTYLWVLDRNGVADREFAGPQGDRWRPATNPNTSYTTAADGDRGVVLASDNGTALRVQRYVDVRGGVAPNQPIPALGVPALWFLTTCAALLARRLLTVR